MCESRQKNIGRSKRLRNGKNIEKTRKKTSTNRHTQALKEYKKKEWKRDGTLTMAS